MIYFPSILSGQPSDVKELPLAIFARNSNAAHYVVKNTLVKGHSRAIKGRRRKPPTLRYVYTRASRTWALYRLETVVLLARLFALQSSLHSVRQCVCVFIAARCTSDLVFWPRTPRNWDVALDPSYPMDNDGLIDTKIESPVDRVVSRS